jgi:hypothetical protein
MNIYSGSSESDASWDGLDALARALTDPALATTTTTTTTSKIYEDEVENEMKLAHAERLSLSRSIGEEIDCETIALADADDAFAAQRLAADALCDAARLLVADADPWQTISYDTFVHGVRDVFVDDPSAYFGRVFPAKRPRAV